jgi:SAM-dependent methyltransferase
MADSLSFWDGIASDWDKAIGDTGNDYWTYLQEPVLKRMVGEVTGQQALDLATGNGIVARWLAQAGAYVLGTDGSQKMVSLATARTFVAEPASGSAHFQRLDLMMENDVELFISAQGERRVGIALKPFLLHRLIRTARRRGRHRG